MADVVKWWTRLTAALTGAVLALVIPAHAWAASNGVGEVAIEATRRRTRSRGGFGFLFGGGLCCLLVIGTVVLVVLLISRNRKRRR
ncbi:hypothetical protein [Actinoplanes regularis]|uniref:MYXO-CTERM domain-containing protein n=1 Tax=Actinoplanes regularis TaxID=52697 RepID=A0A238V8A8_9ACTN|nr:hypothetical protein [Actinoplanes regularis]GIE83827.1 hypothetical protein Are01nite_03070 [Actinoplanes regularis]GLW29723.1 hypothetical protein Areg01_26630 [Actinoplanes regularis]SNR29873.1 hypothetical protein SAMN06264365_101763 [Actinoplanes regularis]